MYTESWVGQVTFKINGALGPEISVRRMIWSEGSPSFLHVNAFTHILYSVFGSVKRKERNDRLIGEARLYSMRGKKLSRLNETLLGDNQNLIINN